MAVGEDDVAEETGAFVFGDGFHDRLARAGQDFPRRFKIQQQRSETVAVIGIGAVVDFQPALRRANGSGPGPDTRAVPHARPTVREATVAAPMHEVRRFGEPDVVAADERTAGTVQGVVFAADSLAENRAVLVVRRENHAVLANIAPVGGAAQADADAVLRDLRKGQVIGLADLRHAAIFDAVGFQFALAKHRRIGRVFAKIDSVSTGDQTKMRHRRQDNPCRRS